VNLFVIFWPDSLDMDSLYGHHKCKTKQPRPERQGQAKKIHPNINTLIEHEILAPNDKLAYDPYTCTISANIKPHSKLTITLDLREYPSLKPMLKILDLHPSCPPISYWPSKEDPTHLAMSPSTFKRLADWANGGYSDCFEWKNCRGAFASQHFLVRTMGGHKVQEDVSLGGLRRFFARDVDWNFALGRATCKPKITCRKRFLQVEPQSAFSRLLFHLMNDAEEDEDADYLATMSTLHQNSAKSSKPLSDSSDTSGASEDDEASCETD
jgi:hypothetical protein